MIELKLQAKHFKNAVFTEPCQCGIANAAKDFFKTNRVSEGINELRVGYTTFFHKIYTEKDFLKDLAIAKRNNFDDTVIRAIKLRLPHEKNKKYAWPFVAKNSQAFATN